MIKINKIAVMFLCALACVKGMHQELSEEDQLAIAMALSNADQQEGTTQHNPEHVRILNYVKKKNGILGTEDLVELQRLVGNGPNQLILVLDRLEIITHSGRVFGIVNEGKILTHSPDVERHIHFIKQFLSTCNHGLANAQSGGADQPRFVRLANNLRDAGFDCKIYVFEALISGQGNPGLEFTSFERYKLELVQAIEDVKAGRAKFVNAFVEGPRFEHIRKMLPGFALYASNLYEQIQGGLLTEGQAAQIVKNDHGL